MSLETLILTELLVVLSLGLGVTAPFTTLCNTFKIKRCIKIYIKFKLVLIILYFLKHFHFKTGHELGQWKNDIIVHYDVKFPT